VVADVWEGAVEGSTPFNFPITNPGQTASIAVTITPDEPVGSVVSGVLSVDSSESIGPGGFWFPTADEVVAPPYQYTVGHT
jgi:hypothetical protein